MKCDSDHKCNTTTKQHCSAKLSDMERKSVLDIHRFALEDVQAQDAASVTAMEAGHQPKERPPSLPKAGSIFQTVSISREKYDL